VAGYLFRQGLGQILERRDFIRVRQRGHGFSQPQVDVPERSVLTPPCWMAAWPLLSR
jgi:hypothetical protein